MGNFGRKRNADIFTWLVLCLLAIILIFAFPIFIVIQLINCFFPDRLAKKRYRHVFRHICGMGLKSDELARRLGMTVEQIQATPQDYTTRKIPKRSGDQRELNIPNEQLKSLQRCILKGLLSKLKTHPAAMGFEEGYSIAHNAMLHTQQAVVIKMDIKDFFPSITAATIEFYFREIGWNKRAAFLLSELCTHAYQLPQGAPTSPKLSNLVNYMMDYQIEQAVKHYHGTYTRYADDITISFPKDYPKHVRGIMQKVRCITKFHGYELNHKKTHILRQHQQQRVTGLVVNDKVNLPREKRRWLRAVEHRLQTQGKASLTQEQLDGYKALQQMIASQTQPKA